MKTIMPSVVKIEKQHLKELVTEVKEILATNLSPDPIKREKKFGMICFVSFWQSKANGRFARIVDPRRIIRE